VLVAEKRPEMHLSDPFRSLVEPLSVLIRIFQTVSLETVLQRMMGELMGAREATIGVSVTRNRGEAVMPRNNRRYPSDLTAREWALCWSLFWPPLKHEVLHRNDLPSVSRTPCSTY